MSKWILIAAGGAAGSVLRYALQGWVQRLVGSAFPFGTLVVNVSGCFALGVLAAAFSNTEFLREHHRLGLTVGVVGGFTTFSTFGLETFQLSNAGQHRLAALYVLLSCGLGVAAVWIGYRACEWRLGG